MFSSLNPYLHGLFAILFYLIGNFFTIIILEYKLKNINLKHTLAGFASVALTGLVVYLVPIMLLGIQDPIRVQIIGLVAAFGIQIIFWWLWFRKDLKKFAPVLLLVFVLTVVIALLVYNVFIWYVKQVAKETVVDAVQGFFNTLQDTSGAAQ